MRASLVALAVLVVAVLAGGFSAQLHDDPRTPLAQAIATLPAETGTASFTDWARVRAEVGGDFDAGSQKSVDAFLSRAYTHGMTAVSVVAADQQTMAEHLGWSVLDLDWEMYSQSEQGAVLVLALSPSTDPDAVVEGLREVGYTAPERDPAGGGVWESNTDVSTTARGLPNQLANIAVLGDRGLVVTSDRGTYLRRALETVRGGAASFGDSRTAREVTQALDRPEVAVLRDAATGCASTSYEDASQADRSRAESVTGDAVTAHHGLGIAVRERGGEQRMRVAMRFDGDAVAQRQARVRRALAGGDAIGQGGSFTERFSVSRTGVDGPVAVLDLRLRSAREGALADLGQGPLLFAWCGPTD